MTLAVAATCQIGPPHRGGGQWNARAHVQAQGQRGLTAAILDINHAQTVADAQRHHGLGAVGQFLHERPCELAHVHACKHGTAQRQNRAAEPVTRIAIAILGMLQVTLLGQGVGQARNG